jgi:hypothetical protein
VQQLSRTMSVMRKVPSKILKYYVSNIHYGCYNRTVQQETDVLYKKAKKVGTHLVCGKYKPKVPKLCTYSILFLLSVFNGTVSRVLIRFCSYKLQFYYERFSDSQKASRKSAILGLTPQSQVCKF